MLSGIRRWYKITITSLILTMGSVGCVNTKPLLKTLKNSTVSEDLKLEFHTIYNSEEKCEPPRLYRRVIYLSQAAMPDRVKLS